MTRIHIADRCAGRTKRSKALASILRGGTAALWTIWASASAAVTNERVPLQPYGTYAEINQCVANMQASLGERSVLGSRDTAAYIQDLGNLEWMGLTEYDVMVGRCKDQFFHRYQRSLGNR